MIFNKEVFMTMPGDDNLEVYIRNLDVSERIKGKIFIILEVLTPICTKYEIADLVTRVIIRYN